MKTPNLHAQAWQGGVWAALSAPQCVVWGMGAGGQVTNVLGRQLETVLAGRGGCGIIPHHVQLQHRGGPGSEPCRWTKRRTARQQIGTDCCHCVHLGIRFAQRSSRSQNVPGVLVNTRNVRAGVQTVLFYLLIRVTFEQESKRSCGTFQNVQFPSISHSRSLSHEKIFQHWTVPRPVACNFGAPQRHLSEIAKMTHVGGMCSIRQQ